MKLRYSIFAFVLLMASGAQAAERTVQQKIQLAVSVLNANNGGKAHGKAKNALPARILKTTDALTVVGYEDGGFAVISNDDSDEPVIGYSFGVFTEEGMPDGFAWWMDAANEALANTAAYARTESYIPDGLPTEVPQMLTSRWGQEEPFNDMCPKSYPSGCVATAMAQIMYYHKYPEHGKGSVFDMSSVTFVDFESATYDYASMTDYYGNGYTAAQGEAVATLMYHCGASVHMQYAESGSGAFTRDAAGAFRNNFLYNDNVGHRTRDYHTQTDWMGMIFKELAAGRPILYGGQSQGGGRDAGHAFVFDGYNADGFVHVNWGWDGLYDGYFDVALLNPQNYEYSSSQQMILGIGMPDETIEHRSEIVCMNEDGFDVTLNGSTLIFSYNKTSTILNYNDYTFDGELLMMLDGTSGSRELVSYSFEDDPMTVKSGVGSIPGVYMSNLSARIPSDLADGTYTLYLAARDKGYTEITPVLFAEGTTRCYTLTKQGTQVTLSPSTDDPGTSGIVSVHVVPFQSDGFTRVYDTEGRLIHQARTAAFSLDDVNAHGVLIIKDGNGVKKVTKGN